MHTLQQGNYMNGLGSYSAECKEYTEEEVFAWNFKLWVSGFFSIGLQWTHMDVGPLSKFTLTWSVMKKWGLPMWIFFIGVVVFGVALVRDDIKGLIDCGEVHRYLIWIALVCGLILLNTIRLKGKRALHIHHYFLALLGLSIIGVQTELMTFVHGMAFGIFIEGGNRWGYDPIWEKKKKKHPWWWPFILPPSMPFPLKAKHPSDQQRLLQNDQQLGAHYCDYYRRIVLDHYSRIVKPSEMRNHKSSERLLWIAISDHQKEVRTQNEKAIK